MKNKQPKVILLNYTPNPIETMCYMRRVMHAPVPNTIVDIKKNPRKWLDMSVDKYVHTVLLKDRMPTFLEAVNTFWKLENVSRVLQQQLTRHRVGFSFGIQSLRCVNLSEFADNGAYTAPEAGNTSHFRETMKGIQDSYKLALEEESMPEQDARGMLPLNIHSTITFSTNLRALIGMMNKRLCHKTQHEFRKVAELMQEEIAKKMDKRILQWIGRPCDFGKCLMESENIVQFKQGKLAGKQNTDHVCPIFINKFCKGNILT